MPSTPYDLVQDDQDLRVPLHAEQAFFHGITFQAKVSHSFLIIINFKCHNIKIKSRTLKEAGIN